jgi:hypothetical protein
MGRPMKQTGELSRYMKNKLALDKEDGVSQPGIKHRVAKKNYTAPAVAEARARKEVDPGDPFVKKMRALYAAQLESGVDGVSSKCHYHGLTGLARSYHAPHPDIKRLMDMRYEDLPQSDKDAIAAYGYEVLMGNV